MPYLKLDCRKIHPRNYMNFWTYLQFHYMNLIMLSLLKWRQCLINLPWFHLIIPLPIMLSKIKYFCILWNKLLHSKHRNFLRKIIMLISMVYLFLLDPFHPPLNFYILLLSISTHFTKMQYLKKSNSHILIY